MSFRRQRGGRESRAAHAPVLFYERQNVYADWIRLVRPYTTPVTRVSITPVDCAAVYDTHTFIYNIYSRVHSNTSINNDEKKSNRPFRRDGFVFAKYINNNKKIASDVLLQIECERFADGRKRARRFVHEKRSRRRK